MELEVLGAVLHCNGSVVSQGSPRSRGSLVPARENDVDGMQ